MRSFTVASLAPIWRYAKNVQSYLADRPIHIPHLKQGEAWDVLAEVKLENRALKSQLELAMEWIFHEKRMERIQEVIRSNPEEKRRSHLLDLFQKQTQAILAPIIYRDPSSWSSSLWIAVGEEENRAIGCSVVAKNSPVVDGDSLVGVIDYVGAHQSRVRLITDSGLTPAVRAMRGASIHQEISSLIEALEDRLEGNQECQEELHRLKAMLPVDSLDRYLAKGVLRGSGAPFSFKEPILNGFGFNYDFPDDRGPARELRTGRPLSGNGEAFPLIQKGDLLVTSGLDGIFPSGLSVAIVKSVFPLKEGAFSYEIQATPTAHFLQDLRSVFVLPPLSGE